MRTIKLPFIVICAVFASCDYSFIKYNPHYSYSAPAAAPGAALCFKDANMKINYTKDIPEEFGTGNREQVIFNYFTQSIVKAFQNKTVFSKAEIDCESDTLFHDSYIIKRKKDGSFALAAAFSKTDKPFQFAKSVPNFAIWICDIRIEMQNTDMTWRAGFVLWDNSALKIVSYGYVNVTESAHYFFTKDNWDNISSSFFDAMVSKLPKGMVRE